jgi:hypothetical protein
VPNPTRRIGHVTFLSSKFYTHLNRMNMSFTSKNLNGDILTGKLWRKDTSIFNALPFYTNIPRMDDIAESLLEAVHEDSREGSCSSWLVVR